MENRGGKRPGAGRKPNKSKDYSESFKRDVLSGLRVVAKEEGMTFGEYLARAAFGKMGLMDTCVAAAWKIIAEAFVVKESKQTVEKIEGPQIMLPPLNPKPMPAGVVVDGNEQEHRVH